jgi:hypothetical protein
MLVRAIYALAVVQFLVATALMLDNMELLKQLGGGPKPPTANHQPFPHHDRNQHQQGTRECTRQV